MVLVEPLLERFFTVESIVRLSENDGIILTPVEEASNLKQKITRKGREKKEGNTMDQTR